MNRPICLMSSWLVACAVLAAPSAAQTWVRSLLGDAALSDDVVSATALLEGPGSGSFVIGSYRATADGPQRPHVEQLDIDGGMVNAYLLLPGDPSDSIRVADAVDAPGGDVVMCGELLDGGVSRPWMARVELATGVVEWTLSSDDFPGRLEAVAACAGGFVASGSVDRGTEDALVLRVDVDGNALWSRSLGDPAGNDRGVGVLEHVTGNIIALASAHGGVPTLFTLDGAGTLLRTRTYDTGGEQRGMQLTESSNGDLWVASTHDIGAIWSIRLWAARISAAGSIVTESRYLSESYREMHAIAPRPDGGCMLVGTVASVAGTDTTQLSIAPGGELESTVRNRMSPYGFGSTPTAVLRELSGALRILFRRTNLTGAESSVVLRTQPDGRSCTDHTTIGDGPSPGHASTVGSPSSLSDAGPVWSASDPLQASPVSAVASIHCHEACPGGIESFCSGVPNSTGSSCWMTESGSTSIAQNDLVLRADNVPANQTAVFFYGANQTQQPLGDGLRCIAHPIFRLTPTQANAAGLATHALDVTTGNPAGAITSGSTWLFQCWYRDPAAMGAGHNVSLGRKIQFCP